MALLDSGQFSEKIYDRFPLLYREEDVYQRYALKRYLQAAADGGFKPVIEEWNGITELIDPEKTRYEVLKILYQQYGLELFNGIPENYLRFLLPFLGGMWERKGNLDVVSSMTSIIAGAKANTKIEEDIHGNYNVNIYLEMNYTLDGYFPEPEQFRRLLSNFLPFYVDFMVLYYYVYEEVANIKAREVDYIENIYTHLDPGFISYTIGKRPAFITNNDDYCLNVNFILNGDFETFIDPDVFEDLVTYTNNEVKQVFSRIAQAPMLNVEEYALNSNWVLNYNGETDSVTDFVTFRALLEGSQLDKRGDIVYDILTQTPIEDKTTLTDFNTFAVLNERKLNVDFILNGSSAVYEDNITQNVSVNGEFYSERQGKTFNPQLNVEKITLNNTFYLNEYEETDAFEQVIRSVPTNDQINILSNEQIEVMPITMKPVDDIQTVTGVKFIDILNTDRVLNTNFIISEELEHHFDTIQNIVRERIEVIGDLEDCVLNGKSCLNYDFVLNTIDCVDYITKNGELNSTFILNSEEQVSYDRFTAYTLMVA